MGSKLTLCPLTQDVYFLFASVWKATLFGNIYSLVANCDCAGQVLCREQKSSWNVSFLWLILLHLIYCGPEVVFLIKPSTEAHVIFMMSYPQAEQSVCVGLLLMKKSMLMTINDALYYVLTLENRIYWNGYTNICMSHPKLKLCFSGKQWSSFLERRKEITFNSQSWLRKWLCMS